MSLCRPRVCLRRERPKRGIFLCLSARQAEKRKEISLRPRLPLRRAGKGTGVKWMGKR